MNHKARDMIIAHDMLRQGDTVIAAVSGGADSVALLDFLCSLTDMRLNVRACHLNHCLRGGESDRDEQLVRTMCREYGVPLDVRRADIRRLSLERRTSVETTARNERYSFFGRLAAAHGAKVATAHTLSDTAETALLNLSRGTGIAGLCGIPPVRDGWIIRPLLSSSREEIEAYCAGHGLCYVTDSTNLSDDYTRNYIRHNVLPALERVNPDVLGAVWRMAGQLRRDADCLRQQAQAAGERCARDGGYDAGLLAGEHSALRTRVIAELLERHGLERSAERIAMIDGMLTAGRRKVLQVGRSHYVVLQQGVLRVECRPRRKAEPIEPRELRKSALDGLHFELGQGKAIEFSVINCADYEIFNNNTNSVLKNVLDYDKINSSLFLRSRQGGDRIRQAGRGCSKPLKKLFSELGLAGRERLCVLADSEGVLYAEGAGADERVKIDGATKRLLTITITGQEENDE